MAASRHTDKITESRQMASQADTGLPPNEEQLKTAAKITTRPVNTLTRSSSSQNSQPEHTSYVEVHREIHELMESKVEACRGRRNDISAELIIQNLILIRLRATGSEQDRIKAQEDSIGVLEQLLNEINNDLILLLKLDVAVMSESPAAMSKSEPDKKSPRQAVDPPVKPDLPTTRGRPRTASERSPARTSLRDPSTYDLSKRASKMVDETIKPVADQEAGDPRGAQRDERQAKRPRQGDFYRPYDDDKIEHNNGGIGRVPTGPRAERQGAQPAYRHNEKRACHDDNRQESSEGQSTSYASRGPSRPYRSSSNCRMYSFGTRDAPIGPGSVFNQSGSKGTRPRRDRYSTHPLGPAYGRNGRLGRYLKEL